MNWKLYPIAAIVCAALSCGAAAFAPPASAAMPQPVVQARSLVSQGNLKSALAILNNYLKTSPQDADARFTRGLILAKQGKTDTAIKAFSTLVRDYPQLPEPYNNLAVLYASKGEYNKARDSLQAALATHPSYATASENLGDVYAALAAQAYNHALKIDKNNQDIRYKLALIQKINGQPAATAAATPAAPSPQASPAPTAPTIASPPPEQQAAAATAPAPTVPAAPPAPTAPVQQPPAAIPPQTAPVETAESVPAAPPAHEAAAAQQVTAAVHAWAAAWSQQNVPGYLAHYAADYADPGMTHAAWVKQRTQRLAAPAHISVTTSDLQVSVNGDQAQATFTQHYVSDTYHDTTQKKLGFQLEGGQWKIVEERSK